MEVWMGGISDGGEKLSDSGYAVLIIHRFCVCNFAFLLKFICNLQISTHSTFLPGHSQTCTRTEWQKNSSSLVCMLLSSNQMALSLLFSVLIL